MLSSEYAHKHNEEGEPMTEKIYTVVDGVAFTPGTLV